MALSTFSLTATHVPTLALRVQRASVAPAVNPQAG
jgi:hypothetical protein